MILAQQSRPERRLDECAVVKKSFPSVAGRPGFHARRARPPRAGNRASCRSRARQQFAARIGEFRSLFQPVRQRGMTADDPTVKSSRRQGPSSVTAATKSRSRGNLPRSEGRGAAPGLRFPGPGRCVLPLPRRVGQGRVAAQDRDRRAGSLTFTFPLRLKKAVLPVGSTAPLRARP